MANGRGGNAGIYAAVIACLGGLFGIYSASGGGTAYQEFKTAAAPSAPVAGKVRIYSKTGDDMYQIDSAGVETAMAGGSGNQGGTTGATTNALVKASAANTLADTALYETTAGILQFSGKTSSYPALTAGVAANPPTLFVFKADGTAGGNLNVGGTLDVTGIISCSTAIRSNSSETAIGAGGCYVSSSGAGGYYFASGATYLSGTDTALMRPAAGVVKVTDGSSGNGWFRDSGGRDYATADQTVDSTTLAADDTISRTLYAGQKCKVTLVYNMVPGDTLADGFKMNLAGGTATMTGMYATYRIENAAGQDVAVTNAVSTTLATEASIAVEPATAFTVTVTAFLEVADAGTFIPNFAKVADVGTGTTKKKYSSIEIIDYP